MKNNWKNRSFSIHFIRNSSGDYSVDLRKLIVKLILSCFFITVFFSLCHVIIEDAGTGGTHSSKTDELKYCEYAYAKGDYTGLKLDILYGEYGKDKDFYKYVEIVDAYEVYLRAVAFKDYESDSTAGEYEEAYKKLFSISENTEYSSNQNVIKKWMKQLDSK